MLNTYFFRVSNNTKKIIGAQNVFISNEVLLKVSLRLQLKSQFKEMYLPYILIIVAIDSKIMLIFTGLELYMMYEYISHSNILN